MNPIIPAQGLSTMMDVLVPTISALPLDAKVGIWTNDFIPDTSTVFGDFVLASAPGLTPALLPAGVNTGPDLTGRDVWTFPTIHFTAGGGGLPVVGFGYVVSIVDPVTSVRSILWFQRWDTAFAWLAAGQDYPLNLTLGGAQC